VEPQRIQVQGNLASAWLDYGQGAPVEVELVKLGELWRVVPSSTADQEIVIYGAIFARAVYHYI